MLIIQTFETIITPFRLYRIIETMHDCGILRFLLSNMTSLKKLITIRYYIESNKPIELRFNERCILFLTSNTNYLCIEGELNLFQ